MSMQNISKSLIVVISLVAVIGLLFMYGVSKYNGMVSGNEGVKASLSDLESSYQRRLDVANQLTPVYGSILKQEGKEDVFVRLAEARTGLNGGGNVDERVAALAVADRALSGFKLTVEAYPSLQSGAVAQDLMSQLEGSENRVKVSRENYNKAVKDFNVSVSTFPNKLFANAFNFTTYKFFEGQEEAKDAPNINDMLN